MAIPNTDYLLQATALIGQAHARLVAAGYSEGLAAAALSRARGMANFKTKHLSAALQGPAFLETLRDEIANSERWIGKEVAGMTGT